ncbi:unnamed protein product, partial [Notodromas monacha]
MHQDDSKRDPDWQKTPLQKRVSACHSRIQRKTLKDYDNVAEEWADEEDEDLVSPHEMQRLVLATFLSSSTRSSYDILQDMMLLTVICGVFGVVCAETVTTNIPPLTSTESISVSQAKPDLKTISEPCRHALEKLMKWGDLLDSNAGRTDQLLFFQAPNNFQYLKIFSHPKVLKPGSKCVSRGLEIGESVESSCRLALNKAWEVNHEPLFYVKPQVGELESICGVPAGSNDTFSPTSRTFSLFNETWNVTELLTNHLMPVRVTVVPASGGELGLATSLSFLIKLNRYNEVLDAAVETRAGVTPGATDVLLQSSVKFSLEDDAGISFSGRPGYLAEFPVRFGVSISNSSLVGVREKRFSVLGLGHKCDSTKRDLMRFGVETISGCEFVANFSSCSSLGTSVQKVLVDEIPELVAVYGDSEPEFLKDWVNVVVDEIPVSNAVLDENGNELCVGIARSVDVDFVVSRFGSCGKPQWKILGCRVKFGFGNVEQGGKTVLFSQVRFLDVSEEIEPRFAAPFRFPLLDFYLPHDFFYPFLLSSSGGRAQFEVLLLLATSSASTLFSESNKMSAWCWVKLRAGLSRSTSTPQPPTWTPANDNTHRSATKKKWESDNAKWAIQMVVLVTPHFPCATTTCLDFIHKEPNIRLQQ